MGEDFNIGRERDIFLSLYPGQIFDTDEQCRITGNPGIQGLATFP